MSRLRQMSIFAYIVEEGSVSAAAAKLDLSKSVVSQHLKALENDLGITLIKRTTRRQVLTESGEHFYLSCKNINLIAHSAWDTAREHHATPSGRIRITAPNALMDILIAPVIADLMKQYPMLKPELISDDQHIDLMAQDIDLAIRVGASRDSNLIQKRLGEFRDVLCGTKEKKGLDLSDLTYISNSWQGKQVTHTFLTRSGEPFLYECEAGCIANSFHSCFALIKAGSGIGIIPDFYLDDVVPEVINLLPDMTLPANTIYALNPYGSTTPLAVKVCIEALEMHLEDRLTV